MKKINLSKFFKSLISGLIIFSLNCTSLVFANVEEYNMLEQEDILVIENNEKTKLFNNQSFEGYSDDTFVYHSIETGEDTHFKIANEPSKADVISYFKSESPNIEKPENDTKNELLNLTDNELNLTSSSAMKQSRYLSYIPYWRNYFGELVAQAPYDGVVELELYWNDGSITYGTGFMVADYKIVTVAHNIYNPSRGEVRYAYATMNKMPSRAGKEMSTFVYGYAAHQDYINNAYWGGNASDYDYAILTCYPFNESHSTFNLSDNSYIGQPITVSGYLGSRQNTPFNGIQYLSNGQITSISGTSIYHTGTSDAGMSGSPIFSGYNNVVGIHRAMNTGLWITPALKHLLG